MAAVAAHLSDGYRRQQGPQTGWARCGSATRADGGEQGQDGVFAFSVVTEDEERHVSEPSPQAA